MERMLKMKGAIFDIDGTLLDSMGIWNEITLAFYRGRNLTLTDKDFEFFKSSTLNSSIPYIKKTYNLPETGEELLALFMNIVSNEYKYNILPKPYALEYLSQLKRQGVKLAIATSTHRDFCEAAFLRLGLLNMFDALTYSDEVGVNKSQPDIYLLAAKRIGVEPGNCMVFEDILCGIKSAGSVGMKTCAVYDDSNKNETEHLKAAADIYITSWKELLE